MAGCCSYCSYLRTSWRCAYCDQTSTLKWNVSTHIKRKHGGEWNPFDLKNMVMMDSYYEPRKQSISNRSNSFIPEIDWSDPQQSRERSTKTKKILEESRYLSKLELMYLVIAIYNQWI